MPRAGAMMAAVSRPMTFRAMLARAIWARSMSKAAFRLQLSPNWRRVATRSAPGGSGFGGYQAIMRDFETGAWIAATEMRKDGAADGY